jgi:hypothetical protein
MNKDTFRKKCDEITEQIKEIDQLAVIDGVIDVDCYLNSPIKVMWILKETNSSGDWSIIDNFKKHEWLTNNNRLMSIRRVIYASYGIMHPEIKDWKSFPWSSEEECQKALRNIAFININKLHGSSVADDNVIQDAYNKNRALLKLQFDTYNPDVVIFGNTLRYVNLEDFDGDFSEANKIKTEEIDTHYYPSKNRLYINAWHPSYFNGVSDKNYVMDIVEITRKWDEEIRIK